MQIWQEGLNTIQSIYGVIEQFNLSVSGLLVGIVLFSLALLFAMREIASWFFKVNDLKRDIARLHEITLQLEGELKLVQNLMAQGVPAARAQEAALMAEVAAEPDKKKEAARTEPVKSSFPIVH